MKRQNWCACTPCPKSHRWFYILLLPMAGMKLPARTHGLFQDCLEYIITRHRKAQQIPSQQQLPGTLTFSRHSYSDHDLNPAKYEDILGRWVWYVLRINTNFIISVFLWPWPSISPLLLSRSIHPAKYKDGLLDSSVVFEYTFQTWKLPWLWPSIGIILDFRGKSLKVTYIDNLYSKTARVKTLNWVDGYIDQIHTTNAILGQRSRSHLVLSHKCWYF